MSFLEFVPSRKRSGGYASTLAAEPGRGITETPRAPSAARI
jgi:hypothetical protein